MKKWHKFPEEKPEINKDIEYIDSKHSHGYAYLCRCGNEWRDIICGASFLVDIKKWRYISE